MARKNRFFSYLVAAAGAATVAGAASLIKAQVQQGPSGKDMVAKAFQPDAGVTVGASYHHDTSPPLRDMPQIPIGQVTRAEHEAAENPKIPHKHRDTPDRVVQSESLAPSAMPAPILNFDGMGFPGVECNCAPPDPVGEVGATQYVQMVNEGYQVFNKTTGASVLGPSSIESVWGGFGGVCETSGEGDPIVMYDQLANRWVLTEFAGSDLTDECIAVSTSADATGSWNRYAFHLGTNSYDYPHLGVWPDAYYMSDNVFNAAGTAYLGPQAFAFDRAAMLAGTTATFITLGITGGFDDAPYLPVDLDGPVPPPGGAPATFVQTPFGGVYKVYHFHVDFTTPANSTFTLFANPAAAGFTDLCPLTRACVPEPGNQYLDGIGDRLMYRLAYRNFGDHESVVGNMTVNSNAVAGIRWFELRGVTNGPVTVFQESTYQPDNVWRWMASAAMDHVGNLAMGFSASSASVNPQIRYAGRLVTDPVNQLSQGEAHLFDGTGAQSATSNRWGDYSDLTIDPEDDCTFWFTSEYYATTGAFSWKTRIGSFKFPSCTNSPMAVVVAAGATLVNESCGTPNGAIDPGETVTMNLAVQNVGSAATSDLVGTLQNTGGVTSASVAQTYGAMAPGATVVRPFTFTASATCGGTLTATLHLQDGATDLGNRIYPLKLGVFTDDLFVEPFDAVTPPALPAGWTSAVSGSGVAWVTSATNPSSVPNDAFVSEPTTVGTSDLVTPPFSVPVSGARLTFKNLFNLEDNFDGMVLEVSVNGGPFTDITSGGNGFVSGGYNSTISSSYESPIGGRPAWTGLSGGSSAAPAYITSVIDLPQAAKGQSVRLRWRAATDSSVAADDAAGARVDSIAVGRYVCISCYTPFTDTPLVAGMTPIKAAHIQELRMRINAVRALRGLEPFMFTDPTLTAGTTGIQAVHVIELRAALNQAYVAAGVTPPTYSDASLSSGITVVTAAQIMELRAAVLAME